MPDSGQKKWSMNTPLIGKVENKISSLFSLQNGPCCSIVHFSFTLVYFNNNKFGDGGLILWGVKYTNNHYQYWGGKSDWPPEKSELLWINLYGILIISNVYLTISILPTPPPPPPSQEQVREHNLKIRAIIIDCGHFGFIDSMGAKTMASLVTDYKAVGVCVVMSGCSG